MRTFQRLILGAIVATVGLLLASQAPAAALAGRDASVKTVGDGYYLGGAGSASFKAYGEVFKVCDNAADGQSVMIYWELYDANWKYESGYDGKLWVTAGAGKCATYDDEMPEGYRVRIHIWLGKASYGTTVQSTHNYTDYGIA